MQYHDELILRRGGIWKQGNSGWWTESQGIWSQETLLPQSDAVCQNSFGVGLWPVWQRHISLQAQRWPWAALVAVVQASRQRQGWLQGQHFTLPGVMTRMSQNNEENLEDMYSKFESFHWCVMGIYLLWGTEARNLHVQMSAASDFIWIEPLLPWEKERCLLGLRKEMKPTSLGK